MKAMRLVAALAAALFVGLVAISCGYTEWTALRCVRCGKWGLARQLRFGPDVLFEHVEGADHSVPLWTWRLDSGADLDPLLARDDLNASPAPFPSTACTARGHLWLAEQTIKRSVLVERSGSCGMSWRGADPIFRATVLGSEPRFRTFCRRLGKSEEELRELVLPGDNVFSRSAFLAWDTRLGRVLQRYDATVPLGERSGWTPAKWELAAWRREGLEFASWR